MPVNLNYRARILNYLLLLLFLFIAYLPLSSFLFALKNDALTTNFPNKYFFTASLHAGYLPLWNPYVNFGLPLYADPGFAFWNPLTWLFGLIGYSIPMLSVEILLYIWLAGIASFELGIWLGHSRRVSFCMGAIYMCCGFFIGNLQHTNFLTSAAFLPFVFKTWLDLHQSFTVRKFFFCLVSIYMLATGGHPAIPIACIYFLLLVQTGLIIFNGNGDQKRKILLQSVRIDVLLSAGFLVLAAPLIFSYYEIYPHFVRSAPVNQTILPDTGFDLSSYLSFVFPFSTTGKNKIFSNDLLMRDGYFSLAGLFCLLVALVKNKNAYQKTFLLAGSGMLLLSLGGPIKEFLYSILPLLNHVRTNGEFRVFSLLSFILIGAYVLDDLLKGINRKIFDRLLILAIIVSFLIIMGRFLIAPMDSIFPNNPGYRSANFLMGIKNWLYGLTFSDRLFLNAVLLAVLIGCYLLLMNKAGRKIALTLFILADLITFSWTQLPVTGVQMKSPATLQHYFSEIPKGIPIPRLQPLNQNQFFGEDIHNLFGCWSYYSKQPGTPFLCSYPSGLKLTTSYFNSTLPDSLNHGPFLFTKAGVPRNKLKINSFSSTNIEIQVQTDQSDSLILLQNYYFRWRSTLNGKPVRIEHADIAFMAIPLEKGTNNVSFFYNSQPLWVLTLMSLLAWTGFSLFAFKSGRQKAA
jgi:Bacterial membrane protein YfhO